MTKKLVKSISVLMAAMMLVLAMGASCFAVTKNVEGASTADTKVNLTQAATPYDFEVTETILMDAAANAQDATVDSFTIKNDSAVGKITYNIQNAATSGWAMKDYADTDWANEKIGEQAYGLFADDTFDMFDGAYTPASNELAAAGTAGGLDSLTNTFTGKVAPTKTARSAVQVGTITATVSWVEATN